MIFKGWSQEKWQTLNKNFLGPQGLITMGLSVRYSVHLSGRFLGIRSLFFPKFWHGVRNPCA